MTEIEHPMHGAIVLVVDDNPEALSLINDILEQEGISVLLALEGNQALTITKKLRPDMILMDAIMPNMNGFEACSLLKSDPKLAAIPVIFMTGLTDTDSIVKGLDAGGVDYLTKPIKPLELLARMQVHLTNARIFNSAQSALDATGNNLFTVDELGDLLWATPQTYALFSKAGATKVWQKQQLPKQLPPTFSAEINGSHNETFSELDYRLEFKLVEKRSATEYLFKLIDGQGESVETKLQNKLNLTAREAEVLLWIANGKTNREIGQILGISPRTINKHLEQLFPKLGVENRTAAAGTAIRALNN